jgi:ABC-2 type transport system permease protein
MTPIARASLREVRTTLIGSGVIVFGLAIWVCAVYPSFSSSFADFELPSGYEAFLGEADSITSPEGFLSAEFFSWIPALWAGVAIAIGAGAIGGEESEGTLEVLLAQPISRLRVVLEKAGALSGGLVLAIASSIPAFALGLPLWNLDVAVWRVAVALGLVALMALVFLLLSMWLSTLLATRRQAALVASAGLIGAYFVNTLGAAVPSIDAWRPLSPMYWADASIVLTGGFSWWRLLVLIIAPVILLLLTCVTFQRREVGSGNAVLRRPEIRLARTREG